MYTPGHARIRDFIIGKNSSQSNDNNNYVTSPSSRDNCFSQVASDSDSNLTLASETEHFQPNKMATDSPARLSSDHCDEGRRSLSRRPSNECEMSDRLMKIVMLDESAEYDGKNGLLASMGYDKSKRIWDPEFLQVELKRFFKMALSDQLEQCLTECDSKTLNCFIYPFMKGHIISLLLTSSLDVQLVEAGIHAFKIAAEMACELKPKRSWKNLIIRPDYDAFTDEQMMAEVVYGASFGAIGWLIMISDKSYRGLISTAAHFNKSFKMYFETLNIAKYRKKWQHPIAQQQFEMGMNLAKGMMSLMFSFAPPKLATFFTLFGLNTDLEQALEKIHQVADCNDPIFYILSALTLFLYHGLFEPIHGCGEWRKDILCNLAEKFVHCDFYGHLRYYVLGARELSLGNIDKSIAYGCKTREALSYFGNITVVTGLFDLINYLLKGDMDRAIECLQLFDKMNVKAYLPSFLIYIHAAALRYRMDQGHDYLEADITTKLKQIKNIRGFFILRKIFYEKMIEKRSKQFCNHVRSWLLPHLEVLYIGNFLYIIVNQDAYIKPMQEAVESKMSTLDQGDYDYWDKYAYLMFFRAFLLKLSGNLQDSLPYFYEILSLESMIERERHLIPQTTYEIGLVHRANGEVSEAKRWFNKASKFTGYITEFLIKHRCNYALTHIKPMEYKMPDTISHLPL